MSTSDLNTLSPRAERLDREIQMLKNVEMKSQLSVVADSAKVEIWYINQEHLELLPPHVRNMILGRLRTH